MYKKYLNLFLTCVFVALICFILGTLCRNIILKINHLESDLTELKIQQNKFHEFDCTYTLSDINLEDKYWGTNTSHKPHIFFVISSLNCSLCLDKFMQQIINMQDSFNLERTTILLLNSSPEILYRYKRIYKIKIPTLITNIDKLNLMMHRVNTPYVFVTDSTNRIMHLYSDKTFLTLSQYLDIIKKRYFIP